MNVSYAATFSNIFTIPLLAFPGLLMVNEIQLIGSVLKGMH